MYLIWNAGSSSIKYALYKDEKDSVVFSGSGGHNRIDQESDAIEKIVDELISEFSDKKAQIIKIGHRIVHGGDFGLDGMMLDEENLSKIDQFSHLAPLHNPNAIAVARYMKKVFPGVAQHGFFDTSFFSDLSRRHTTYPIDKKFLENYKIKRYGFHGISHEDAYIKSRTTNENKVITVHLGGGCSIAASTQGKAVATSMGFTPLEGLMMQSRSGDLDPGLVLYMVEKLGYDEAKKTLEEDSGLKGLTATSGNMLDVLYLADQVVEDEDYTPSEELLKLKKIEENVKDANTALDLYIEKIRQYIGAYSTVLSGIDKIVFTGKVGSGSTYIRERIVKDLDFLGRFEVISHEANEEKAIAQKILDLT